MKKLVLSMAIMMPMFAFAQDYYTAVRWMLLDGTQKKIAAAGHRDYAEVCKGSMGYYLAFEAFENKQLAARLSQDLGTFSFLALSDIGRSRLPVKLHKACSENDKSQVELIMAEIQGKFAQE